MSARRFSACSRLVHVLRARLLFPKLTVLDALAGTPSNVRRCFTASARCWPSARLYSRLPRSSVLPSTRTPMTCVLREVAGVGGQKGRRASFTWLLLCSKYDAVLLRDRAAGQIGGPRRLPSLRAHLRTIGGTQAGSRSATSNRSRSTHCRRTRAWTNTRPARPHLPVSRRIVSSVSPRCGARDAQPHFNIRGCSTMPRTSGLNLRVNTAPDFFSMGSTRAASVRPRTKSPART